MAAPGAYAVMVALSTLVSAAAMPVDRTDAPLNLPRIALHVPATVPAAASPHMQQDGDDQSQPDVDITGPAH